MKIRIFTALTLSLLAAFNSQFSTTFAQGTTAFTYRGQLHGNVITVFNGAAGIPQRFYRLVQQ